MSQANLHRESPYVVKVRAVGVCAEHYVLKKAVYRMKKPSAGIESRHMPENRKSRHGSREEATHFFCLSAPQRSLDVKKTRRSLCRERL